MRFGEPPDYDARVRLLRGRDFRLLVLSNGLSSFGDELALVALTIKVADLTSSGLAIAGLLLVGILPMVLFAPIAGALVDRTETTGTLAIASLLQAAIALGLAFSQALWLILVLSFLLGTVASVASPAVFALVPKAVDEEDLTPANARMETARYVGMVAAPIAVAALAGQLGDASPVPLVVDAVTFLVIASAAASLSIRRPPVPEEAGRGGSTRRVPTGLRVRPPRPGPADRDRRARVHGPVRHDGQRGRDLLRTEPRSARCGQLGLRCARGRLVAGDGGGRDAHRGPAPRRQARAVDPGLVGRPRPRRRGRRRAPRTSGSRCRCSSWRAWATARAAWRSGA